MVGAGPISMKHMHYNDDLPLQSHRFKGSNGARVVRHEPFMTGGQKESLKGQSVGIWSHV